MGKKIKVALVGVGNCSSFLVQAVEYYRNREETDIPGIMHVVLGDYKIEDIEFVAAFDVDKRKVGKDLGKAIFQEPNNAVRLAEVPKSGVRVEKGPVLDGIGDYLKKVVAIDPNQKPVNVADVLKDSKVQVVINYLPVGSYDATRYYAQESLDSGCGFINAIPEFLASGEFADRFEKRRLPILGDDIKGQLGASILSRTLARLFKDRGTALDRMYQLNFGGNTDFLNLLEESRLKYKRISKTETVQSVLEEKRLDEYNIKIGPSDYVPWLGTRKIAQMRFEGRSFGDITVQLDVKLDVDDKSVSAGIMVDAIRCCRLAMDRKIGGALVSPSSYFFKVPPIQYPDYVAREMLEEFIQGKRER
ncbi:MAG: Inositol-1-phosphate synthase [Candidatus Fermentimicrarchaeum limneticum]|uniref:Inositol-1-phosphate synthase n=1 Tax=Fermentimicrarchaeum limneticum TaxID=2795018 RepID=A0A7D6BR28_FERL1|nr:MAG: Inositol-1-phosphate synthase [Candidatus Fermentimicrarchaeum limneticum]